MRKIGLATVLAGALLNSSCQEETRKESNLPEVGSNQSLILHPDHLRGSRSIGYTLLTDIDYNGDWDIAERLSVGFTTGDFSRDIYFKKGFGPAQSMNSEYANVRFVEPDFFKPYQ